jgi:hypothetical protein
MIWHVIFHPKDGEWWTRRFGHVSLAGFQNETWVHLDLGREAVTVKPMFLHDETVDYLSTLLTYYTLLRFGPAKNQASSFFMPMTCVSFVKHTLGIRSRALLPDQLFHSLIRDHDAEVLNENAKAPCGNGRTEASSPAC